MRENNYKYKYWGGGVIYTTLRKISTVVIGANSIENKPKETIRIYNIIIKNVHFWVLFILGIISSVKY